MGAVTILEASPTDAGGLYVVAELLDDDDVVTVESFHWHTWETSRVAIDDRGRVRIAGVWTWPVDLATGELTDPTTWDRVEVAPSELEDRVLDAILRHQRRNGRVRGGDQTHGPNTEPRRRRPLRHEPEGRLKRRLEGRTITEALEDVEARRRARGAP